MYRHSPRPSLRSFVLKELNAAVGTVSLRDYVTCASLMHCGPTIACRWHNSRRVHNATRLFPSPAKL